jgi:hypothetical protein
MRFSTYPLLTALTLTTLGACQGLPFVLQPLGGTSGTTPPGPTPQPPVGACPAPAVVGVAAGAPIAVEAGYHPAGVGLCVPVRDFAAGRIELLSDAGTYRLAIELAGSPTVAGAPATLKVGLRYTSGAQPAIPDAVMTVQRRFAGPSAEAIENPALVVAGAYELAGFTWPRAGRWLVTLAFTVGGAPDSAHFAVDVAP